MENATEPISEEATAIQVNTGSRSSGSTTETHYHAPGKKDVGVRALREDLLERQRPKETPSYRK